MHQKFPKQLCVLSSKRHGFFLILLLTIVGSSSLSFAQPRASKTAELPKIVAKSAIVLDRKYGIVLGEKNPDHRLPMASTTKIMTALITLEAIERGVVSKSDMVRVSTHKTNPKLFKRGDKASVGTLLKALMVKSANEAALSLAIHVNRRLRLKKKTSAPLPNEHALFVKRMNKRARQLKMSNSHFTNAHGRDPEDVSPKQCTGNQFSKKACKHFSTARDIAKLTRAALRKEAFRKLVKLKKVRVKGKDYQTTNFLLKDIDWIGAGWTAYGVKTGTTNRAGHCLSAAAKKGDQDVIVVVLGATRRWQTRNRDDFYNASSDLRVVVNGKEVNNSHRYEDVRTLLRWVGRKK